MRKIETSLVAEIETLPGDYKAQLASAFAAMSRQADEWLEKANGIVVTSEADTDAMQTARHNRLELRQIRINAEKARKEMKAGYLAGGRAVDAVANVIKNAIEPIEAVLLEKEEFVERKVAKEKAERRAARDIELRGIGVDIALYMTQAWEFTDEQWWEFVQGQKDAIEARNKREADEAAAREAERVRVVALDAENQRLREEKFALEKAARIAAWKAQQEAAKAKAAADAEAAKADMERREREAAERAAADLARREKEATENAPDVEKVKAYIAALAAVPVPDVKRAALATELATVTETIHGWHNWAKNL